MIPLPRGRKAGRGFGVRKPFEGITPIWRNDMGMVIGIAAIVALIWFVAWLWYKHPDLAFLLWIFSLLSD